MDDLQLSLVPDLEQAAWPSEEHFALNEVGRHVEPVAKAIVDAGEAAIIVTGFTSLDYLISALGDGKERDVDIVLGNEPSAASGRDFHDVPLNEAIQEYWLKRGLSILSGSAVMSLIEAIGRRQVRVRVLDKLHAKIVFGPDQALLGSSNFSRSGLVLQREANVRFERGTAEHTDVGRIATNFVKAAAPYDRVLCELLEQLLKPCEWPEALARATAELLEGTWLQRYDETHAIMGKSPLWPSQRQAIAQALFILDSQESVLIADPTGSGKTRLGLHLILALINRLYRTGRGHRTNALVVCPPLVRENWQSESASAHRQSFAIRTMSHGILSSRGAGRQKVLAKLRAANILVLDEAHNYLNRLSTRSRSVATTFTDHVILLTATPINRGPHDLLRLVEILGIDNLSETQWRMYRQLQRGRRSITTADQHRLRDYVKQFTVRRTKNDLNKLIDAKPDAYTDEKGRRCRYPIHKTQIYSTGESDEDKRIAEQINGLCQNLTGLLYLRTVRKPVVDANGSDAQRRHLDGVLHAARALARYNVQATMRSSKAALYEHLLGTDQAIKAFALPEKLKGETGNVVETLKKLQYDELQFELNIPPPSFMRDAASFEDAKEREVGTYLKIAALAMRLSNGRDEARIRLLEDLLQKHRLVLAFDSRIITIEYLHHLINKRGRFSSMAVHGSTNHLKAAARRVMSHGSEEEGWVALCSDAMSEGVNLQGASAVVLLDMPGVIRLAEQRIGRIDRMNSEHAEIEVFWPNDSAPFCLTTSRKFVKRYQVTRRVIGVNMPLPEELKTREEETFDVNSFIGLIDEVRREEEEGDSLQDAFLPVRRLREDLVPVETYEQYRTTKASVLSRVSFVSAEETWAFFALRGSPDRAPQWILV